MKSPDLDRERSEKERTLVEFVRLYNENLPATFQRASAELLEEFKSTHGDCFKKSHDIWSLDLHRKKVMDWLRSRPV